MKELALLQTFDVSTIICTSDIIESMFGKYKERAKRSGSTVTDDCINMANLGIFHFDKKVIYNLSFVFVKSDQPLRKNCFHNLYLKDLNSTQTIENSTFSIFKSLPQPAPISRGNLGV